MRTKRSWIPKVFFGLTLALVLGGCEPTSKPPSKPASELTSKPLTILNWQLKKDTFFAYVEGVAQNTSSRKLAYAEVWAYFYDAAGRRLGEFLANVIDLKPGETWRFKITYFGNKDEVVRAEVKVGSCRFG